MATATLQNDAEEQAEIEKDLSAFFKETEALILMLPLWTQKILLADLKEAFHNRLTVFARVARKEGAGAVKA